MGASSVMTNALGKFESPRMSIAFYAPLKSPNHPIPSGDRQMGRLLMLALKRAGFSTTLASELRAYLPKGDCELDRLQTTAAAEVERLLGAYDSGAFEAPRLWFTYHPYYKSPDLIGPVIAKSLQIPYVTAEASHAAKRAAGPWARAHAHNQAALTSARLHLCFTERDKAGLAGLGDTPNNTAHLPPFIDTALIPERTQWRAHSESPIRLLTVAMMRPDVKLQSYQMLAEALKDLQHLNWSLDIVGDGDARPLVERAFSEIEQRRLTWHGRLEAPVVAELYGHADLYVWPGFGEAYGMAYLEAQAGGSAVVAQDTKGIPSVVQHGSTGLLTPENDVQAYRNAIANLIEEPDRLVDLGRAASRFVRRERSVETASASLKNALEPLL